MRTTGNHNDTFENSLKFIPWNELRTETAQHSYTRDLETFSCRRFKWEDNCKTCFTVFPFLFLHWLFNVLAFDIFARPLPAALKIGEFTEST